MESSDDINRRINYRLCTAVDMLNLGIILDEMVELNLIDKNERRCFYVQAAGLLASMRNANNRGAGLDTVTPIM